MEEILLFLRRLKNDIINNLDDLDVPVSTRADQGSVNTIKTSIGDLTSRSPNTLIGLVRSLVGFGEQEIYDNPGVYTFEVPEGVTKITVTMVSGGGGGGAGSSTYMPPGIYTWETEYEGITPIISKRFGPGSAGGNGALFVFEKQVTPGSSYTVVVGAGGAAGQGSDLPAETANGLDGGASSFDSITCTGGKGGGGGAHEVSGKMLPRIGNTSKTKPGGLGGTSLESGGSHTVINYIEGTKGTTGDTLRYYLHKNVSTYIRNIIKKSTTLTTERENFPEIDLTPYITLAEQINPFYVSGYGSVGMGGNGGGSGSWGAEVTISGSTKTGQIYATTNDTAGKSGTPGQDGIVIVSY